MGCVKYCCGAGRVAFSARLELRPFRIYGRDNAARIVVRGWQAGKKISSRSGRRMILSRFWNALTGSWRRSLSYVGPCHAREGGGQLQPKPRHDREQSGSNRTPYLFIDHGISPRQAVKGYTTGQGGMTCPLPTTVIPPSETVNPRNPVLLLVDPHRGGPARHDHVLVQDRVLHHRPPPDPALCSTTARSTRAQLCTCTPGESTEFRTSRPRR